MSEIEFEKHTLSRMLSQMGVTCECGCAMLPKHIDGNSIFLCTGCHMAWSPCIEFNLSVREMVIKMPTGRLLMPGTLITIDKRRTLD